MDLSLIYAKKNNIFQSDRWAEFQKSVGREVLEIGGSYFVKEKLVGNKSYLFCPKSGLESQVSNVKSQNYNSKTKNFFSKDKLLVFVRVEPNIGSTVASSKVAQGYKKITKYSPLSQQYSPKQTLVLDLTKREEDLLAYMKPKHRYNIRLAEKKGIEIQKGHSPEDVANFSKLSKETMKRDAGYSIHAENYYKKMAEILGKVGGLEIFTAFYGKKPLSSIIVLFFKDTAIYLHGSSSNEHRELMPNHLVQWEAIKEAKKRGCKYYDFWGIAVAREKRKEKREKSSLMSYSGDDRRPESKRSWTSQDDGFTWKVDEKHPWAGITRFKLGFAKLGATGEVVEFPGAYDLILNPFWYKIISSANKIRKLSFWRR